MSERTNSSPGEERTSAGSPGSGWLDDLRHWADVATACAGPFLAVAVVVWAVRAGDRSRFIYFADTTTAAIINFWLAIALLRQLWDASSSSPFAERWIEAAPSGAVGRLAAAGRRFTVRFLLTAVGVSVVAPLLRIPLAPSGAGVVAVAVASIALTYDLGAWWVASLSAPRRRAVRVVFALIVGFALAAWLVDARSRGLFSGRANVILPQLLTAGPWQWFYPSRWVLDVLERVVNGRAFVWVLLEGIGCALFLTAVYVRARPVPTASAELDPPTRDEHVS